MKINRKLLIAFLLISLVPLIATSLISYYVLRENIKDDVESQLEALVEVQHTRLENIVDRDYERLALVTSRTQLRLSLEEYNQNHSAEAQEKMNSILEDAASSIGAFRNIAVLDAEGKVAASTDPSEIGKDESESDLFINSMSGEEAITLFLNDNGDLMQYLSGPLVLDDIAIGTAIIESDTLDLIAMVSDYTGLGSTGETLVAKKDEDGNAQFIHPLRFDKEAAFSLKINKGNVEIPINIALSGKTALIPDSRDYRDEPVVAAVRYVEDTGWGVVVKQDVAEAFSAIGTLRNMIGLLFILTSILVIVVSIFVSGTITKPITDLTKTAEEISSGDLDVKADESRPGEIGILGHTFNQMTSRLAEARDTLEEKVRERTEELEAIRESLEDEITEREKYEEALEESEDKYRDLFENAGDLIQSVDPEGNFIYVNPTWKKVLGYSEQEVMNLKIYDIIHPDCMDFCMDSFKKVMSGEEMGMIEACFKAKDGRKIEVEGQASCRFLDGKPFNTRGIFRDVTERKKAEEEISRLAALVKFSEDAIIGKNLDGTITSWNTGAQKVYGYKPEEVIGKDISFLEPEEHSGETHRLLKMVGDGIPVESFETKRLSKEGKEIFVSLTISPVKNDTGEVIGASAVAHDITERVKTLEDLSESEERFRTIASTVNDAIILADITGTVTFWNPAAEHIFGYKREEALGLNMFQSLVPPENREEIKGMYEEFVKTGEGFDVGETREYEALKKNGERVPVELSMSSVRIGGHWRAVGVLRDITARKKATEALRESEEKFRTIASTANDAIILIDNDGRVAFWNSAAEKMFGYPQLDVMGKELHPLLAPAEYIEDYRRAFEIFKKTGEGSAIGTTVEMKGLRDTGDSFPIELSLSSIRMQGKWQAIGIIRDITERKEAEEQLQKINTELEGFAHTVSHDLKGPLTAIIIAVDTIKELASKPRSTKTLVMLDEVTEILDNNVKNASNLIEDLLSLAEAGQKPLNVTDLDIQSIINRVVGERLGDIERLGVKLDIDEDLGRINGSFAQIYQVFTNLIGNALKHCKSDNPVIKISYLGEDSGGAHRYIVRDNGKGIPEKDLGSIFLPFYMGEGGGTGIGLSTVQKIVELYGGKITAYNDNGACFEFTLKDLPGTREGNV